MKALKTLRDAIIFFADPIRCREYLVEQRWPDGVDCPRCGSKDVLFLEKYNRWHCRAKHDAPQFTLKTGTVMEDSAIGLEKWLPAFWLLANCKNGISSYELHRALGVTQQSAWFMLHRIRYAMQDDFHAGSIADFREETDLRRTDWQGGRNKRRSLSAGLLGCGARNAGSGTLRRSLRRFFCFEFRFDCAVWNRQNTAREINEGGSCSHYVLGRGCGTVCQWFAFLSLERRVGDCVSRVNLRLISDGHGVLRT